MSDNVPTELQLREMAGSGAQALPPPPAADVDMPDSRALVPYAPSAADKGKAKKRRTDDPAPAAPDGAAQGATAPDGEEEVDLDAALDDAASVREVLPALLRELKAHRLATKELSAAVKDLRAQNTRLSEQLDEMKAKHEQELQALRDSQYQLLEQLRAQRRQAIEASLVLMPVPPEHGTTGPDLTKLGQLDAKKIATLLSTPTFKVTDAHIRRITKYAVRDGDGPPAQLREDRTNPQPCARIEVHFADVKIKYKVMASEHRRAVEDKVFAPLGYKLKVRDNLLVDELKEKRQLHKAAMSHLIDKEKRKPAAERAWYGWRRSRITWRVRKPDGGDAWALLSHLDVPEGSSEQQVLRAKELAEARALAAARAGPAPRTQRGPARSTPARGAAAAAGPARGAETSAGAAARASNA